MNELFAQLVEKFSRGEKIDGLTNELNIAIKNNKVNPREVIFSFIQYMKLNYLNKDNYDRFVSIYNYLSGKETLENTSKELFINKIGIDQDKRDSHPGQFRHNPEDNFLEDILRVIYNFTRGDIQKPLGVCYDFCLFIAGLSLAKNEKRKLYLWNSIEDETNLNNFILFSSNSDGIKVYDPYNELYMPIEDYNYASLGFRVIDLNTNDSLLKRTVDLTGFNQKTTKYKDIIEAFGVKKELNELESLTKKNYYERLGVTNNASFEEIKTSFRRVVAMYHPDKNPDDKDAVAKTRLIIEAYECLKNNKLRREYDLKLSKSVVRQGPSLDTKDINVDDEIEKLIREFVKKYGINSFLDIFNTFTKGEAEFVRTEQSKNNLIYNNLNIYDKLICQDDINIKGSKF